MSGIVDDLGADVTLPAAPRRIVSLVPNLSETLWAWGLGERLVGVTDWCVEPAGAFEHATRVRGTKNPDLARIRALAPDLVIANEEENRELDVNRLRAAGLVVHVTRVRTVLDAAGSLERLGAVLGVARAGRELAQDIRAARRALQVAGRSRVFCAVWRQGATSRPGEEQWWGLGADTYGGDLLACCGFDVVPVSEDARYPRHRLADVAACDPDLVLLPDEPFPFRSRDAAVFSGWRARIVFVDGRRLWWWGHRTATALSQHWGLGPPAG